jgi:hypothetical protein
MASQLQRHHNACEGALRRQGHPHAGAPFELRGACSPARWRQRILLTRGRHLGMGVGQRANKPSFICPSRAGLG